MKAGEQRGEAQSASPLLSTKPLVNTSLRYVFAGSKQLKVAVRIVAEAALSALSLLARPHRLTRPHIRSLDAATSGRLDADQNQHFLASRV